VDADAQIVERWPPWTIVQRSRPTASHGSPTPNFQRWSSISPPCSPASSQGSGPCDRSGPPFALDPSDLGSKGPMPDKLLRVLVVDDNRDNADIVRQYLESTKEYAVDVAYDGDEALRRFQELEPHVVLLDVMMPGRDGWEVCRLMKSDPARATAVRVIMVTARGDLADKQTALQSGADDFLEKPLDFSKLRSALRRNAATLAVRSDSSAAGSETPASSATQA